jgi:acetyltransferase-like isoleucine patch superfamily enzyme
MNVSAYHGGGGTLSIHVIIKDRIISFLKSNDELAIIADHARIYFRNLSNVLCTGTSFLYGHWIRSSLFRYVFRVRMSRTSYINRRCKFTGPFRNLTIGDHSIIGSNAMLDFRDKISIGNNVNIGDYLKIYTMEHDIDDQEFGATRGPVNIEDWVYIGAGVTILPGVNVGEGAVVATGAVVTKDVPAWTMVGGVPARFIKVREVNKYTINTRWKMPWR